MPRSLRLSFCYVQGFVIPGTYAPRAPPLRSSPLFSFPSSRDLSFAGSNARAILLPLLLHFLLLHLDCSFGSPTAFSSTTPRRPRPLVYHRLLGIPPFFRVFGEPRAHLLPPSSALLSRPTSSFLLYTRAHGGKTHRPNDRARLLPGPALFFSPAPVLSQILVAGYEIARKRRYSRARLFPWFAASRLKAIQMSRPS